MRVIEKNGWTVYVEIFREGDSGWILQIGDGRGNGTVWKDFFHTQQAALDAAYHAIDKEGIEAFIGPDSEMRFLFDS